MTSKYVTRDAFIRMNKDPYRFECEEGHTSLRLLQLPQIKKRGNNVRREVFEHANGKEFEGLFYCQTCNENYSEVYDKKRKRFVYIDPPRK